MAKCFLAVAAGFVLWPGLPARADLQVATNVPAVERPAAAGDFIIRTTDGKCTIALNTTEAPALKDWAEHQLAPVLAEWYPKIVALLPSEGFTAPDHFSITLKPMAGVAATSGKAVTASSVWLEQEIGREAIGALVHETVHVVQQYGNARVPGWLTEGLADYIRWFKFEPQSHGADMIWLRRLRHFTAHYNDGYRVTANFLNWVTEKYDPTIICQLNAAMRDRQYDDGVWKKYTGKTAPELGAEWQRDIEAQLSANQGKSSAAK